MTSASFRRPILDDLRSVSSVLGRRCWARDITGSCASWDRLLMAVLLLGDRDDDRHVPPQAGEERGGRRWNAFCKLVGRDGTRLPFNLAGYDLTRDCESALCESSDFRWLRAIARISERLTSAAKNIPRLAAFAFGQHEASPSSEAFL